MRLNLPIDLHDKTILLAGAGGGWDVFGALPLAHELEQRNCRVVLANYSSSVDGFDVRPALPADHPEGKLAAKLGRPVYVFGKEGAAQLRAGYERLIQDHGIDAINLFTTARLFLICYGANDLDESANHEATSSQVIAHLGQMVQAVRKRGRHPILLDIPDVNARLFPGDMLLAARAARSHHNAQLKRFCQAQDVPLAVISDCLGEEHFGDACHPNVDGARIIAAIAFEVLGRCVGQGE